MNKQEFITRRKHLMEMMGENTVAILPAAPMRIRNRDVEYAYRPDSDFYYLTGFPEPEAVAVLIPGREHGEYILFCRERDPKTETWTGRMAGQEGAVDIYGADDSFPIEDIDELQRPARSCKFTIDNDDASTAVSVSLWLEGWS